MGAVRAQITGHHEKKTPCTESREVKKTILSEHFWDRATNFRELMVPVVFALRELDAKMSCMGKVLYIMRNLEKHVFSLRKEPFGLSSDLAIPLEKSFCK